ncbi:hypothetical protein AC249_AIPGENE23938 [Exaiptasia diaphana]|nr:hypothetical protein AC249_AIPGENE23938 [Exaiptasia diaphana]
METQRFLIDPLEIGLSLRRKNSLEDDDPCLHKSRLNSIMPMPPNDRAAYGHVLRTYRVISLLQCLDFCARNSFCSAFNYETKTEKPKKRRCELLSRMDGDRTRVNFTYQLMDHERFRNKLMDRSCGGSTRD